MDLLWIAYPVFFLSVFLFIAFAELVPKSIKVVKPDETHKQLHDLIDQLNFENSLKQKEINKSKANLEIYKIQTRELIAKLKKKQKNTEQPSFASIENPKLDEAHYQIRKLNVNISEQKNSIRKLEQKVKTYEEMITGMKSLNDSMTEKLENQIHTIDTLESEIAKQTQLQKQKTKTLVKPQKEIAGLVHTFKDQLQELRRENSSLSEINHLLIEENSQLKNSSFL